MTTNTSSQTIPATTTKGSLTQVAKLEALLGAAASLVMAAFAMHHAQRSRRSAETQAADQLLPFERDSRAGSTQCRYSLRRPTRPVRSAPPPLVVSDGGVPAEPRGRPRPHL